MNTSEHETGHLFPEQAWSEMGGEPRQYDKELTPEENEYKDTSRISVKLEENKRAIEEKVSYSLSFDVIVRQMEFAGVQTMFFYLNGFVKDTAMIEIMERLSYLKQGQLRADTAQTMMQQYIPHVQVEQVDDFHKVIDKVLAGGSALFIEGEDVAILIDAKTFPSRSIAEPELERVVRGSRDAFVETMLTNVTLIRRRLRDPRLVFETMQVGTRTKTDVCLAYIRDIVDMRLVKSIQDKIKQICIDGIPLADKQLEEAMVKKGWNPYPMVRYTERPDVIADHIMEGHVVIIVDTSPSAMILPTTFFHHVQHAEEYRQTPFIGTYLRWVRFIGIMASLFLMPMWFLLVLHPELKPPGLEFLGPNKTGHLPLLLQFILVELGVDLMRMAAVHTPSPLAVAMGLVAAILIGDIAVQTGLFVNEVILYMAFAVVGMFATPSYELGLANRIVRLFLLIAVALFKVPGLIAGSTIALLLLVLQRSFNTPYMWPFIPFDPKAMLSIIIRKPVLRSMKRPSITRANDSTKQPQQ